MKPIYTATAIATGAGRDGRVVTDDNRLDLKMAVPIDMGGTGGATNPEQLFACGYAACFHNALQRVAGTADVDLGESEVTASVSIGAVGEGYGLAVSLDVAAAGVEKSVLDDLVEQAHRVCPYSNATRGNIDVEINVRTEAV